jgi:hypothetical protein
MIIKCKSWEAAQAAVDVIEKYLRESRFFIDTRASCLGGTGGITIRHNSRRVWIVLNGIRLRAAKGYCGNHAGPCRVTGKKHQRNRFLEGLDWVSFDDMLNDALDSIHHDGNVESAVCVIRKGRRRRVDYYGRDGGEFDRDTNAFEDYCGRLAPPSEHQRGTPGIIGWREGCVESPYEEAAA